MSEMIIESPYANAIGSGTKRIQAILEQDALCPDLYNWTGGAGTPYPSTPLSESRYDGVKCFDDCDPWTL